MKHVLFYGIDAGQKKAYQEIAEGLESSFGICCDRDLLKPFREVLEEGGSEGPCTLFAHQYMLIDGFDRTELVTFLRIASIKKQLFGGIKVLRNERNQDWPLGQVLEQAAREKKTADCVMSIRQLLAGTKDLDLSRVPEADRQRLDKAIRRAYAAVTKSVMDGQELQEVFAELMHSLQACRTYVS